MNDIALGFIMGFMGLFFPNARTLSMIAGHKFKAVAFHVVSSILWATSIYYAAQLNLHFIFGNLIGGSLAIYILTSRQGK